MVAHSLGVAFLAVAAALQPQLALGRARGDRQSAGSERGDRQARTRRPVDLGLLEVVDQRDHAVEVVDLQLAGDIGPAEPQLARSAHDVGDCLGRAHREDRPMIDISVGRAGAVGARGG